MNVELKKELQHLKSHLDRASEAVRRLPECDAADQAQSKLANDIGCPLAGAMDHLLKIEEMLEND